jgi:hypothetical protein
MVGEQPTQLTMLMEGHDGHRGNVLAHVWPVRLLRLVGVLARMERIYVDAPTRKTDYELVELKKVNPTIVEMRPVPKVRDYDPLPAFAWAIQQLRSIGSGDPVDPRVDARTAGMVADLADPEPMAFEKFWINGQFEPIIFDALFAARARVVEAERLAKEQSVRWFAGHALGSVVGSLRYVDDIFGERRIALRPVVGVDKVECIYPPDLEETIRDNLFQVVSVTGRLKYEADSPHPKSVEVREIKRVGGAPTAHLSDLRGLFRGYDKPSNDLTALLDG